MHLICGKTQKLSGLLQFTLVDFCFVLLCKETPDYRSGPQTAAGQSRLYKD